MLEGDGEISYGGRHAERLAVNATKLESIRTPAPIAFRHG
jgi:hypothetical protein